MKTEEKNIELRTPRGFGPTIPELKKIDEADQLVKSGWTVTGFRHSVSTHNIVVSFQRKIPEPQPAELPSAPPPPGDNDYDPRGYYDPHA